MRLAIGTVPSDYANLPRFLIRLERPRQSERALILGRIYIGYVGIIWITNLFELDIWLHRPLEAA